MITSRSGRLSGLAVAAVLASTTASCGVVGDDNQASATYCAMMPDSVGLYVGNPVTQMGYQIGTITDIEAGPEQVKVLFTVDGDRPIPASVQAVTRSKSVLADRSLELVGSPRGVPSLVPESCVPLANSHVPESISEVVGSAADLIDEIAPDGDTRALQGAITGLSESVDGLGPDVASLMETAARAAESPERMVSDIGKIIAHMTPVTDATLEKWREVATILSKMPESLQITADVLWPGTVQMMHGIAPFLNMLIDIQTNYGEEIWAAADVAADVLHVAATNVDTIERGLSVLPNLASTAALAAKAMKGRGVGLRIAPPGIRVPTGDPRGTCERIGAGTGTACSTVPGGVRVPSMDLLAMLLGMEAS
ncbi:MCE family protein [Gordonia sp. zg691]|uniref:MlaD family protein n=1 Tax=Gordonia jinghuaiqii TaxID=2758710 RepID=UPI0016626B2D|nr:MlaD family protein [Gordonia jinghuaiqii]MBD0863512.1 MCE family protein [Gordonia jinghuaiqii]